MSPRVPDRPASSWVQVGASRCPGGLCALERFEREGKASRWVGRAGPYLEGLGQVSRDFAQACGLPKVHARCVSLVVKTVRFPEVNALVLDEVLTRTDQTGHILQ